MPIHNMISVWFSGGRLYINGAFYIVAMKRHRSTDAQEEEEDCNLKSTKPNALPTDFWKEMGAHIKAEFVSKYHPPP
jgi:hypothetical protein